MLSSADTGESGERGPGIELELPDWEPITFSLGGRTLAFDTTSLPDVLFVGRDGADTGGAGPVEISMEAQPRTDRRLVIGGGTGLDLSWPVLRLSLEAEDEADYGVELVSRGSKVAVKAGEGDSFLRALIAGLDFEVDFDLGLEWSRSRGLTLSGTAALENRIALNLSLGPLSLTWLDLILALDGDVIRFSTGSELELRFEPFDVTIEGLGAEATLDFASETRNLGFCDLRLVFRPPTRVVLVIDSDVVKGGGFVLIDPIAGRYAGGLALAIRGDGFALYFVRRIARQAARVPRRRRIDLDEPAAAPRPPTRSPHDRVGGRNASARSQKPRFGDSEPKVSVAWTPRPSTVASKGPKRSTDCDAATSRTDVAVQLEQEVEPRDRQRPDRRLVEPALEHGRAAEREAALPRPAEAEVELDLEVGPADERAQERVALGSLDRQPRASGDDLDPVVGLAVGLERQSQRRPREVEPGGAADHQPLVAARPRLDVDRHRPRAAGVRAVAADEQHAAGQRRRVEHERAAGEREGDRLEVGEVELDPGPALPRLAGVGGGERVRRRSIRRPPLTVPGFLTGSESATLRSPSGPSPPERADRGPAAEPVRQPLQPVADQQRHRLRGLRVGERHQAVQGAQLAGRIREQRRDRRGLQPVGDLAAA